MAIRSFTRGISVFQPLRESLKEPLVTGDSAHGRSAEMWKKIFLYGCIPSLILCGIHISLLDEPERPEFKPYDHLRIRSRNYPWGDGKHSLLHNPHTNALPDGYEH